MTTVMLLCGNTLGRDDNLKMYARYSTSIRLWRGFQRIIRKLKQGRNQNQSASRSKFQNLENRWSPNKRMENLADTDGLCLLHFQILYQ